MTIYVGNIDERVNETLLWELFMQAAPVVTVNLPKDRVTQTHQGFGFVEFVTPEDAEYAIKVMPVYKILNMVKLYGKPLRCNKSSTEKVEEMDIGANVFVGNLDPEVDEKLLNDSFGSFGKITQTKISRDTSGYSKGFAFISYETFEAADSAIDSMNGQFLMNRSITVSYALKKDGRGGERHGSAAERLLAAQSVKSTKMPNRLYNAH